MRRAKRQRRFWLVRSMHEPLSLSVHSSTARVCPWWLALEWNRNKLMMLVRGTPESSQASVQPLVSIRSRTALEELPFTPSTPIQSQVPFCYELTSVRLFASQNLLHFNVTRHRLDREPKLRHGLVSATAGHDAPGPFSWLGFSAKQGCGVRSWQYPIDRPGKLLCNTGHSLHQN